MQSRNMFSVWRRDQTVVMGYGVCYIGFMLQIWPSVLISVDLNCRQHPVLFQCERIEWMNWFVLQHCCQCHLFLMHLHTCLSLTRDYPHSQRSIMLHIYWLKFTFASNRARCKRHPFLCPYYLDFKLALHGFGFSGRIVWIEFFHLFCGTWILQGRDVDVHYLTYEERRMMLANVSTLFFSAAWKSCAKGSSKIVTFSWLRSRL